MEEQMGMEHPVTLEQMLEARERRVRRQRTLLEQYGQSLVCLTMNIAGPVKTAPLIRRGFSWGEGLLLEQLTGRGFPCLHQERYRLATGNEGFYVVSGDACALKQLTVELEERCEIGRLLDLDVLDAQGEKMERQALGLPPRRCLICGEPAWACARSRRHSVQELRQKTETMLREAFARQDAQTAAGLACRSLLYEVCVTPKPGLVDRKNSGSHRDMDLFTFLNSTSALFPYFERCVRQGMEEALGCEALFAALRWEGKLAERAMLAATGGVNTHKGAIFSMGLCCAALGRLPGAHGGDPEAALHQCAALARGLMERDFRNLTPETARTAGEKLYLRHGVTGVRGQAEAGFPAVRLVGLPTLEEGLAQGLSWNDAGCKALLALMGAADDTNLMARGGMDAQRQAAMEATAQLQRFPDWEGLDRMDRDFIARNLSPGGSADLLALCYMLCFLKMEAEAGAGNLEWMGGSPQKLEKMQNNI